MQISLPTLFINQSNFQVPSNYVGVSGTPSISGGPLGHFVLIEGPVIRFYEGSGASVKVVAVPDTCHVTGHLNVHGSDATLYQCADGPMTADTPALYLGHELLTWKEDGLNVQVSFHGHSNVNISLDLAVGNATLIVNPDH